MFTSTNLLSLIIYLVQKTQVIVVVHYCLVTFVWVLRKADIRYIPLIFSSRADIDSLNNMDKLETSPSTFIFESKIYNADTHRTTTVSNSNFSMFPSRSSRPCMAWGLSVNNDNIGSLRLSWRLSCWRFPRRFSRRLWSLLGTFVHILNFLQA